MTTGNSSGADPVLSASMPHSRSGSVCGPAAPLNTGGQPVSLRRRNNRSLPFRCSHAN
jgi:hypothetical protein